MAEVPGDIDIDGNLPDYVGSIEGDEADTDEVPFCSLLWDYGGFCGSGAAIAEGVRIADLRVSSGEMSYRYVTGDLRKISPGNSHENPDCLACLFVRGEAYAFVIVSKDGCSRTNVITL